MGKKGLTWTLILVFCFGVCMGSIVVGDVYPFAQEQAEPMHIDLKWPEDIREIMMEGSSPYIPVPWSEQKPCEQYSYADWDGSTYASSNRKIGEEKTGEYLGSVIAYGQESLYSPDQAKNIRYIGMRKGRNCTVFMRYRNVLQWRFA